MSATRTRFSRSLVASAVVSALVLALPQATLAADTKTLSTVKVEAKATKASNTTNTTSGADSYKAEKVSSPKRPKPLLDTPKSIQVITEKAMKEQGVTSLRDALKNISGISMAAGEGGVPTGDNLTIRGFSARTDLFIDGVRDISGYNRDSFNMEQVEVAKGPDSAVSGRGSTGGSVNMVSKSAKLDAATTLELGLGTDGLKRAVVDVNQPINDTTALRVAMMGHEADNPGRNEANQQRWGIAPTISFGIDTDTRFLASHLHQTENNLPDYGIPYLDQRPAPIARDSFFGMTQRDFEDIEANVSTLKFEHDFSDSLSLSNKTRRGEVSRHSIVTAPRFVANSRTLVNPTGKGRDTEDSMLANQTDLTAKFDTGAIKHTLITGIEFAQEESHAKTLTVNPGTAMSLTAPTPDQAWDRSQAFYSGATTDVDSDSQALYMLDTAEFSKDWFATAGVRWDSFETTVTGLNADGSQKDPLGSEDSDINWNAGLSYKPSDNDALYLSYATSINPSAEGLSLTTSTAALDPEESRSLELGAKSQFLNDQLLLTGALFRTDKTNARTPGLAGEAPTVLSGEQRVTGFELSATGFVSDWMQIIASYTKLNAEIIHSNTKAEIGKKLAHVPPQSFSLWTTFQASDALSFGFAASYKDIVSTNLSNTANQIPDYTLYDAMAAYQVSRNVSLRLNAYNLTDETYFGTVGGGHTVPGAGRSAVLTGTVSF